MKPTTYAALAAVLLVTPLLGACEREEIDYYEALLTGKPVPAPDYAPGSLVIAEIIESTEPSSSEPPPAPIWTPPPPLDYTVIEGETGPMGETVATGVDCTPLFRVRICK